MKTPKRGRPVTTGTPPPRQIGRIHDAEWQELRAAAAADGLKFAVWARRILLEYARNHGKNTDFQNPPRIP